MFGRRNSEEKIVALPVRTAAAPKAASAPSNAPASARKSTPAAPPAEEPYEINSNEYYEIKLEIFNALIEVVDVVQITKMNPANARIEIRDVVNEIIVAKKVPMSLTERQDLIEDICNDVLGYGPLEPLLARDDIADIMVNGNKNIFIEVKGRVRETSPYNGHDIQVADRPIRKTVYQGDCRLK